MSIMSVITEPPPSEATPQRRRRGLMPPEVVDLIVPPLKFGAWCGMIIRYHCKDKL